MDFAWQSELSDYMLNARFTGEVLGRGGYGVVEKVSNHTIQSVNFICMGPLLLFSG